MPWHIGEQGSHDCDGFPVIKDEDDSVAGCHATMAEAEAQLQALYANEPAMMQGMGRFIGVAALADVVSIDSNQDRMIPAGSVKFDGKPIQLTWAPTAAQGHEDGLTVGSITKADWSGDELRLEGFFDSSELAQELRRQLLEGMPWGLSIESSNETLLLELRPDGSSKQTVVDGLLTGVLVTKEAALHGTWIKAMADGEAADITDQPVVVAATYPAFPPTYCFEKPELDALTPITVDGPRVYGHLAGNGCHRGFPNTCIRIGDLSKDYSQFARRTIPLEDGSQSPPVGQITLAGGHADLRLTAAAATQHYDDTRSGKADIAVWWDEKNESIVCSGALRPGTTDEDLRLLLASDVSVDYRYVDGERKLIAALCVNTPGFPIPPRINALVASGEVMSLVMPPLSAEPPENGLDTQTETEAMVAALWSSFEIDDLWETLNA